MERHHLRLLAMRPQYLKTNRGVTALCDKGKDVNDASRVKAAEIFVIMQ
jgi:hypothetical protein